MLADAATALSFLFTWETMLVLVIGTTVGMVVSVMPGISGINAMALLLPLTFTMDRTHAFVFLVTIMAAGGFSGAVTSILINVPGEGINAATTLDGYPLARQGRAGEALGAAATASALGSLFGILLLSLSLPFIRSVLLAFGPPEFFAFTMAGVALIASVSGSEPLKGLISGAVGLFLGAIGYSIVVGGARYTYGIVELRDGIPLIPAIIGLFAIPELFDLMKRNEAVSAAGTAVRGGVWKGVRAVLERPMLLLRSSAIGTGIGIVPGVGGAMSSWVAYFAAVNASKDPDSFGKGNIEGVIAPEAANDSKAGGSMMPLLALGIPGSISTAILASAFLIHGVQPGQRLFQTEMPLVWSMIFAMALANVLVSSIGLASANLMVKFTLVPAALMAPAILVLAMLGSYIDPQSMWGVLIGMIFGFGGLAMVRLGYPRPPLLVGLILFSIAEDAFHTSTQIHRGSYVWFLRPITLSVLLLTLVAVLFPIVRRKLRSRRAARDQVPEQVGRQAVSPLAARTMPPDEFEAASTPTRPSKADIAVPVLLLVAAGLLAVESFNYGPDARFFPLILLIGISLLCLMLLVRLIRDYVQRPAEEEPEATTAPDARPAWAVALWILALPVLLWLIGIVPGTFVFVLVFRLFFEGFPPLRRVATALVYAGVFAFLVSYVFGDLLGVRMPPGLLY